MITLNDYLEARNKQEIDFAIKYAEEFKMPIDSFGIGDLTERNFGLIKDLQTDADAGNLSLYRLIDYHISLGINDIGKRPLLNYCQSCAYIISELNRINELENELLISETTTEEIVAGIDELKELGVYLQIRQIAITLHYTIEQVRAMPYRDAFVELVTQKRLNDYQKNYFETIRQKNNR